MKKVNIWIEVLEMFERLDLYIFTIFIYLTPVGRTQQQKTITYNITNNNNIVYNEKLFYLFL